MPANKLNYLVIYKNESQVYGASSKETALTSPLPEGTSLDDKRVLFISYEPDNEVVSVYMVPHEEILSAELKEKKPTKKKANVEEE